MTLFRLGICPARLERPRLTQIRAFMEDPVTVDAYLLPEDYFAEAMLEELQHIAKNAGKWIFAGMRGSDNHPYAVAIDGNGQLIHRHKKIALPSYARAETARTETREPGTTISAFDTPWGRFGFLLCYELLFPEIARKGHKEGVKLFLNPIGEGGDLLHGMDIWSQMGRVRALENNAHIAGVSHSHLANGVCYAANSGGDFYFNSEDRLHMTAVRFDMNFFPTSILENEYQRVLTHIQQYIV
ncbi:MAG TPA: carbon-nitrogen hydrolase family protein [Ktedonobacteraceae bacterium]